MSNFTGSRARSALLVLVAVAVLVSVVHYADNYFNYDDFPASTDVPTPSRALVGASWFGFTALALLGVACFLRERFGPAALCLALYSGSGLVGIGHYTVPGATAMPWWRQGHVIADVLCGIALLAFALLVVRRAGPPPEGATSAGRLA